MKKIFSIIIALEDIDSPYCSMGYSEEDIDSIITDIFEYTFALKA